MANFTLPIGTSDPVTVCNGLPLFPNGAARAGIYGSSRSSKLLDTSGTIFVTRLKVSAYAEYAFGVCGPAVAFLFKNIQAQTGNQNNEGKLTLTFQDGQQLEAGGFIGASVGAGINLALQIFRPTKWYKPWEGSWLNAFSVSLNVSIDFLGLLVELIKYLLSRNSRNTFEEADESVLPGVKSYSFLDFVSNPGVQSELSAAPELVFPINIVNLVPGLKALNASFSKIGGEISVGPSLHIGLPVTFRLDSFNVEGGLQGENSATYGKLTYQGTDKVVATGKVLFDESVPTKMTTAVHYETGFALGLSFHFRVTVAKMFNFEVNGPTLDFTQLLFGSSNEAPTIAQNRSVSTGIQNGCLLIPNLTLNIKGVNSPNISTGDQLVGVLGLSMPYSGPTAANNVSLKIEPDVPGFPRFLTIANGATSSNNFYCTIPNQSLLTGNLYDPSETTPPGPEYTVQTYTVTASIPYLSSQPCSEFEVVLPLNVNTRYIRCQRNFGVAGSKPPWDESANALASATVNVNSPLSAFVGISCWFPYPAGQAPAAIPITFTLLDENRSPHSGSNVEITASGSKAKLAPSATLNVTPSSAFNSSSNFSINWLSKATPPYNNYSNRFFLVVDAGPAYGRTEFWLDVWNWS